MNCKPNDLAIIYKSDQLGIFDHLLGRIIRVTELCPDLLGVFALNAWHYEGDPMLFTLEGQTFPAHAIPDMVLKPIRDSDKEDESLRWAPSPKATL